MFTLTPIKIVIEIFKYLTSQFNKKYVEFITNNSTEWQGRFKIHGETSPAPDESVGIVKITVVSRLTHMYNELIKMSV